MCMYTCMCCHLSLSSVSTSMVVTQQTSLEMLLPLSLSEISRGHLKDVVINIAIGTILQCHVAMTLSIFHCPCHSTLQSSITVSVAAAIVMNGTVHMHHDQLHFGVCCLFDAQTPFNCDSLVHSLLFDCCSLFVVSLHVCSICSFLG